MAERKAFSPSVIGLGESARIVFMLVPTPGTDVMTLKAYSPNNIEIDMTTSLRAIVASSPATLSFYAADISLGILGDWYFEVKDATSGDWGSCMTSVRQWATNMDKPVSQVMKQRVDIDRLRTTIRNKGGR